MEKNKKNMNRCWCSFTFLYSRKNHLCDFQQNPSCDTNFMKNNEKPIHIYMIFFQQKWFFFCALFSFSYYYIWRCLWDKKKKKKRCWLRIELTTLCTTVRLPPAWATCPDEMTLYFLGPLSHFDFKRKKHFLWWSPGFELWSPTPESAAKPTELTCRGSWRLWSSDLTLARFATGLCREKYTASHFVQV